MAGILLSFSALFVGLAAGAASDAFARAAALMPAARPAPDWLLAQSTAPKHQKRATPDFSGSPFFNDNSAKFAVNGSGLPLVPFDVGESYAGLLPISDDPNETRELWFWLFPSDNPLAADEITIWFNGGPGCSSLTGFMKENGPILFQDGTAGFTPNTYAWRNLTNIVYIEQPIGVGFTQGTPNITNEVELGQQFIGFWKNFAETFQLQNHKVFITGESYAGFYIPYVADAFIGANDTEFFNLAGVAINDPIIGDNTVQQDVIVVPFVDFWAHIFNFNDTFNEQIHAAHVSCGYEEYIETFLTYPPPAEPATVPAAPRRNTECATWDNVGNAITLLNPCFNVYHITDFCPFLTDAETTYFNRPDVQEALHAVVGTVWQQCTSTNVFPPRGDQSPGPAQDGVLQRVIEHTNNSFIGVGALDYILPFNGTLLALQNTTWNGLKGFQAPPSSNPLFVPFHRETNENTLAASGIVGTWGAERGLTYYQVEYAGHQQPQYGPGSSFRVIEALLGRITALDQEGSFTTQ